MENPVKIAKETPATHEILRRESFHEDFINPTYLIKEKEFSSTVGNGIIMNSGAEFGDTDVLLLSDLDLAIILFDRLHYRNKDKKFDSRAEQAAKKLIYELSEEHVTSYVYKEIMDCLYGDKKGE